MLARSRDTVIADCGRTQPTLINGVPIFISVSAKRLPRPRRQALQVTLPQLFGGNLRACICGGGGVARVDVCDFYHARGLLMLPGYGLTESSPVIAMSSPDEFRGTVGKAIPGIEVRIAEDGELLTRGPHVMKEYWKDPELSQQTIRDGWLYTGDLGTIDADGYISITGRKKELIALPRARRPCRRISKAYSVANR